MNCGSHKAVGSSTVYEWDGRGRVENGLEMEVDVVVREATEKGNMTREPCFPEN